MRSGNSNLTGPQIVKSFNRILAMTACCESPFCNLQFSCRFCRQIEGKVVEISRLQDIFTEKVLEQVSVQ